MRKGAYFRPWQNKTANRLDDAKIVLMGLEIRAVICFTISFEFVKIQI